MFDYRIDDKLSLRLLQQEDVHELFSIVDRSRNHLREWLPWVDGMKVAEDYEPVIAMWLNQFAEHNGLQAGIIYQGKIAGVAGYHGIDWRNRRTSIGYWLAEEYQGEGIMTSTVQALTQIAFDTYKLNRVDIQCGVDNRKSRSIPERLGFHEEGVTRDGEFLYDYFHDLITYRMLSREWSKKE